jgi:predicted molibdopterin-dependent oxidoreductase YjgC
VAGAFEKLDFFVVQDIFFSETCRYADVILPGAPALEKEGTFSCTERRIQRLYQALPELGDSRADWKITQDIANRMGVNWNYQHPSEIMAEMASLTPLYESVSLVLCGSGVLAALILAWPMVALLGRYAARFLQDAIKEWAYARRYENSTEQLSRARRRTPALDSPVQLASTAQQAAPQTTHQQIRP